MSKIALISGITGQDGSYLAELLLDKGYTVHGIIRRSSCFNTFRIDHLHGARNKMNESLFLHYGDITDAVNITRLVNKIQPDEIYNMAALSHVQSSFDLPEYTLQVEGVGALRFLEAIKESGINCRFYQASSADLFGNAGKFPQNEDTPFRPKSPHAIAKLYAYWTVVQYREAYNIFACNGIAFAHESERRGKAFVTRKISLGVARILNGQQEVLRLGNLEARRDWGYAPEYVEGMWRMLQADTADDYVLATGESHSVREFVDEAFYVGSGKRLQWRGSGIEEKGYLGKSDHPVVIVSPRYYRPTDINNLMGDYQKAKKVLGWAPKITFKELVRIMVEHDIDHVKKK
ncbi:GDP-mannose 4,6-dehydratase [Balneolaceae bacterium ANBcel3]|nr:GDP-mannose 4,6-dehydratase [Balneolaceae bacterium ANBcel3]